MCSSKKVRNVQSLMVNKQKHGAHTHTHIYIFITGKKNPLSLHLKLLRPWTVSVCYSPLHSFALTTCFIIVCGAEAAYQRAACDGFYQCIEDVDRKSQQSRPTVDYSFIHVILKEREKEWRAVGFVLAPMEDLEQTKEYKMRKFFHKQTNWITLLCSTPTQLLLHFSVLTLTQQVNQVLWVNFQVKATVYFEIVQCGVRIRQWEKRFRLWSFTSLQSRFRFWSPTSSFNTSTW